jgi:hypothetical protein
MTTSAFRLHRSIRRRSIAMVSVSAGVLAAAILVPTPSHATTPALSTYGGSAYGSTVALGSLVRSGRTAAVPMCTTQSGVIRSDKSANLTRSGLGVIGAVTTRVSSRHPGTTMESVTTTHTAASSLLAGLIKGSAISTSASAAHIGDHYTLTASTTLDDFTVGGVPVPEHPTQDQTVAIPGIGRIVFNHQSTSTRFGTRAIAVTGVRLTLTAGNTAGLPAGSITIGHATAALHGPTHHRAYGSAFGTTLHQGGTTSSGHTAPVYLPCGGSAGAMRSNTSAGVNVPSALHTGTVASTATSTDSASLTTATTRSRVSGVNLLGGVVTAGAVIARAHASRGSGGLSRSSYGTEFADLRINGTDEPANVPANTTRTIPGVGTLYLNRVINTPTGVHVYALELVLSKAVGTLVKGSVFYVSSATAGVANH